LHFYPLFIFIIGSCLHFDYFMLFYHFVFSISSVLLVLAPEPKI
jgi:hypothetical protein